MALLEHIRVGKENVRLVGGSEPDPEQHAALTRAAFYSADVWSTGVGLGEVQHIATFDASGGALFDFTEEESSFIRVDSTSGWFCGKACIEGDNPVNDWFGQNFSVAKDSSSGTHVRNLPHILGLAPAVVALSNLPGFRTLAIRNATVGSWKDLATGEQPLSKAQLSGFYALARILFSQNVAEGRCHLKATAGHAWMARTPEKRILLAVFKGAGTSQLNAEIAHWFDLITLNLTQPDLFQGKEEDA